MILGEIRFDGPSSKLTWCDGTFKINSSTLQTFRHRLIDSFSVCDGVRTLIVVCEKALSGGDKPEGRNYEVSAAELDDALNKLSDSDNDFASICFSKYAEEIVISSSFRSTAPIYAAIIADRALIDWDPRWLTKLVGVDFDTSYLTLYLSGKLQNSYRTINRRIVRGIAGSRMIINKRSINTIFPESPSDMRPSFLRTDVDAVEIFLDGIRAVLNKSSLTSSLTCLEISGGMDSALAAISACDVLKEPMLSYGLVFGSEMGALQNERRKLIVDYGSLHDVAFPAEAILPFALGTAKWRPVESWPDDENYPEMFESVIDIVHKAGRDTIITGVGGDELFPIFEGEENGNDESCNIKERNFLTPSGNRLLLNHDIKFHHYLGMQGSSWVAATSKAPKLLERGIWPVHPYTSRTLARFTYQLPYSMRKNRNLQRATLSRCLGNNVYESEYIKESFSGIMRDGIKSVWPNIIRVLKSSVAVDLGVVSNHYIDMIIENGPSFNTIEESNFLFFLCSFELYASNAKAA